jgi:hypothetical protein
VKLSKMVRKANGDAGARIVGMAGAERVGVERVGGQSTDLKLDLDVPALPGFNYGSQ